MDRTDVVTAPERAAPRRRIPDTITYPLITLGIFFLVWDLAARGLDVLMFPRVGEAFIGLGRILVDPEVWVAFGRSNLALLLGYGAAVAIGIPIGLALGRSPILDRASGPYMTVLVVLPTAAVTPLVVMAIGLNLIGNAVLVFLFCFPMIILNTRSAARTINVGLIEMARSYLADRSSLWRFVFLPGSLIGIVAGLRLGLGRAVSGMVIGELLLVATGIGGLILMYQGFYQGGELFALILLVVLESWLLARAVSAVEARLIPWKTERKF